MDAPEVSVVIVTRNRPERLALALTALRYQRFEDFEVVVVGPADTLTHPATSPFQSLVVFVDCEQPNISLARNLGIAAASGRLIAFLDDDAVPEPDWLAALCAGLIDARTGGVGGFVRGSNGVDWQWRAIAVDRNGNDFPLSVSADSAPCLPELPEGCVLKTVGTNCLFRRDALLAVGGFDQNYRFFLDETDLNWRLAEAEWQFAVAPRAVVHHAFAPSERRKSNRVPRDLFELGASKAVFLCRYAPPADHPVALRAFHAEQRRRLLHHLLAGRLAPRDLRWLLGRLEAGFEAGRARNACGEPSIPIAGRAGAGHRYAVLTGPGRGERRIVLAGPGRERRGRELAGRSATEAAETTLITVDNSWRRLRVQFVAAGFWWHCAGRLARPRRDESSVSYGSASGRLRAECERIQPQRDSICVIQA